MGKSIQLEMTDGFALGAYEAEPAGKCKGALVILQEVFGVNPHIRSVVDGYAADGYFAVAPQIFDRIGRDIEMGYGPADIARGVELAFQKLDMTKTLADIQKSIHYAAGKGKVATVGYCFGGLLTWLSACRLTGLSAAVAYYGGGIVTQKDLRAGCPVMMHFGERDEYIPMSDVAAIRTAQPDVQIHVYAADHGFNCDQRGSYDRKSALLARERTLAFLGEHLG